MRAELAAGLGAVLLATGALAFVPGEKPEPTLLTTAGWEGRVDEGDAAALSRWLAEGSLPGEGTRWAGLGRSALADLRRLSGPSGAVLAAPAGPWRHVWPRDSSFVAAALAAAGHHEDAAAVLGFLARVPFDAREGFEARYRRDGSGPPDDRPRQSDGCGWVLWSLERVARAAPQGRELDPALLDLHDRCTAQLLALTHGGRRLPVASADYWELPVSGTTLGTAAPVLAGLRHSARLYELRGDRSGAGRAAAAAADLEGQVTARFGPQWQRYGSHGGLDAAVAMMMPPFSPERPGVAAALERYQQVARRPAGGLAPGGDWPQDGVSWTPETALVAYVAAATGRDAEATELLDWLAAHVTDWGSLPEKVTASGKPAGPAPLAWTAALVVLALDELAGSAQRG